MSLGKSLVKLDGSEGALKLEELLKNNNCMIRFHMYGCMWCNKMKPEWDKLADRLSKSSEDVMILDVDSDAVSNMSHPMKESINGYPTIIYSPKGLSSEFSKFEDDTGRTADRMESWLKSVSKKYSKTKKSKKGKTSKKSSRKSKSKLGGGSRKLKRMRTRKTQRRHRK